MDFFYAFLCMDGNQESTERDEDAEIGNDADLEGCACCGGDATCGKKSFDYVLWVSLCSLYRA